MVRIREAHKNEQDEVLKALQESKELAKEEDKKRKDESVASSETPLKSPGFLNRANRGSKSMTRKSFAFLGKDKDKSEKNEKNDDASSAAADGSQQNGSGSAAGATAHPEKADKPLKDRFSFGLGRKKSERALS